MPDLSRRYRYSTRYSGFIANALAILPVGLTSAEEENRFHIEVNLITRKLYGFGSASNDIYTAHGPVLFQHMDMWVNRRRAQAVMKEWRAIKRSGSG